jgi:diaminopimelate decarboxylase
MDYQYIKEIETKVGSPFYIMHPDVYEENVKAFATAFRKRYEKLIIGYSFKTNYVPALCLKAKQLGCYAEVVSDMEMDLALSLGFEKIIFNGPIKRDEALRRAISAGAIINIDAEYEVDFICQYRQEHPGQEIKAGLRLNVLLTDENGNSVVQNGLRFGRFGFPHDILSRNIQKLREAGIKIISVHGHTSSSDRAVINYQVISDYMLRVCEEFELNDIEYFDIGGGYFGAAPEGLDLTGRPKYEDYANIVVDSVEKNEWFKKRKPYIVIEPGSSVVSNVFKYYTKVYQIKHIGDKNFAMVDGTVFDVKPTMHSNNLPHVVISDTEGGEEEVYDVVGSTCMEKDVILKDVPLKRLKAGDYIEIGGVGAYTICLTPTFINYLAPIVSIEKEDVKLVRRRQQLDDILTIYER